VIDQCFPMGLIVIPNGIEGKQTLLAGDQDVRFGARDALARQAATLVFDESPSSSAMSRGTKK